MILSNMPDIWGKNATLSFTIFKAKLKQAVCSGVKITLIFKPLTYTGTPLIKQFLTKTKVGKVHIF